MIRFMINTGKPGENPIIEKRLKIGYKNVSGKVRHVEMTPDYFLKLWKSGNNCGWIFFYFGQWITKLSINISSNPAFVQFNIHGLNTRGAHV